MSVENNVHKGHRERTIKKFLESADSFSEHEVLEVLLYYAVPRIDTNPLAHRIIQMFGSLDGVFNATAEQLMMVDGVGEKVATQILLVSQIVKRVVGGKNKPEHYLINFARARDYLLKIFRGLQHEKFVILLLNNKYKLLANVEFSNDDLHSVKAEVPDLVKAINIYKPTYAIIAHNHPSGNVLPSDQDDFTTKKLNVLLDLYDVNLFDHIIVSGEKTYSYNQERRIDEVKKATLNQLFNKI